MLWLAFVTVFLVLWAVVYAAMPALRFVGRRLARLIARSSHINDLVAKHKEWLPVLVIVVAGAELAQAFAGTEQGHAGAASDRHRGARLGGRASFGR